jgi:hypothetical protein
MADFVVPKGKEFRFNIKVIEKDSFIPEDVTNLDTINSSIKFMNSATMACIDNTGITIEKVPDDPLADPLTYLNGIVGITVPSTITNLMVIERGDKVDNYYLKPTYQMIVDLVFTDSTPSRVVVLDKVYVVPASC